MKLFAITLISLLLLCGCAQKKEAGEHGDVSAPPVTADGETQADKARIKSGFDKDIGASADELKSAYGEITDSTWEEGPMYRFGNSERWYNFSDYTLTDDGKYLPKGKCTHVIMPVYELIDSPSGEYSADVFAEATGAKVSRGYSEINEVYYFVAQYKEFKIVIYGDLSGEISESSNAEISKAD